MEDSSVAQMKEEITRLNKIINVLIEQNDMLKAAIADSNFYKGNKNLPVADSNFAKGNDNLPIADTNFTNGNKNLPIADSNFVKGNENVSIADSNFANGNNNIPIANSNFTKGNTNVLHELPDLITITDSNVHTLFNVLKNSGFNKVKRRG